MRSGHVWLLLISLLLRVLFFAYGIYQDAHCQVRYTDIDYFVFHDAAGYVYEDWFHGYQGSPFMRDTYRYTPLLSWLLVPNHYFGWIHCGKVLFVIFDLITGAVITKLVQTSLWLPSIWLLNPMVITISTRGNAESILSCLIMLTLYWLQRDQLILAGFAYGLSIHFKIYPIIYCLPLTIYVCHRYKDQKWLAKLIKLGLATLISLIGCSAYMYHIYGHEYLENAYFYHLYRTDHRHNFSLWNILLYFDSANPLKSQLAKLAFLPQLVVTLAVPILQWSQPTFQNLLSVLFVQTFAFVTFNKVCTSQYFVWYLIFLPFYMASSTISWKKGVMMLVIWGATQGLWLLQGYRLEFLGENVFYPELLVASASFFLGNIWLLGQFIDDIKNTGNKEVGSTKKNN